MTCSDLCAAAESVREPSSFMAIAILFLRAGQIFDNKKNRMPLLTASPGGVLFHSQVSTALRLQKAWRWSLQFTAGDYKLISSPSVAQFRAHAARGRAHLLRATVTEPECIFQSESPIHEQLSVVEVTFTIFTPLTHSTHSPTHPPIHMLYSSIFCSAYSAVSRRL